MIDHGHEANSWVDVGDIGRSPRQPVHYELDDVFSYVTLVGARYWLVTHRTEGRAGKWEVNVIQNLCKYEFWDTEMEVLKGPNKRIDVFLKRVSINRTLRGLLTL